jgi:hypothetical protein
MPQAISKTSFATWQLLEDLIISISGPEYVIQALGERIDLSFGGDDRMTYTLKIVWNPARFDILKQHFWKENLGPECLVEYSNSEKHLFLGVSHYELLNIDTGILEFYTENEVNKLHNQYSYPFLRWIGRLLNSRGFAPIHAAAIGDMGSYVLVPGKATAGKSTTTATWMIHKGDYLSDDFVFLSGNSAHGYYRGINLRHSSLSLFKDTIPDLFQKTRLSPVNEEKIFMHDSPKEKKHKTGGNPSAIWCPEIGYSQPHFREVSKSYAYNSLLSSIQFNKEFQFDLRLCHQTIKSLVNELPAFAICLTADISENFRFMQEALRQINQDKSSR